FVSLEETEEGTVAPAALEAVQAAVRDADALALGPGMTTNADTRTFIRSLVRECAVPLVLDADGLNAFAGEVDALSDRKGEVVLTPHLGEFSRLVEVRDGDRLAAARRLAGRANAVALLKGSRTVIATPDGVARINPTGSAVLATAGTGDVLTGAIGGLLARGVDPFAAAWSGAYLHGLAGIAAGRALAEGTLAGDVAERLSEAPEGSEAILLAHRLTPSLYSQRGLRRLAAAARGPVAVHVKIDTGMHRVGLWPAEAAPAFLHEVRDAGFEVEGLWTHLAKSEDDEVTTKMQLDRLDGVVESARAAGIEPRYVHAANSGGLLRHPEAHLDLVRPGIAIYGIPPAPGVGEGFDLRPALTWRSAVAHA